jgi:hypothetical protein
MNDMVTAGVTEAINIPLKIFNEFMYVCVNTIGN